jgi:hypothetical protein
MGGGYTTFDLDNTPTVGFAFFFIGYSASAVFLFLVFLFGSL